MQLKRTDGGHAVFYIIADDAKSLYGIETFGHLHARGVVPQTEALRSQQLPGKMAVGIHLATGRYIRMTDKVGGRDTVFFFKMCQQPKQAVDLRIGKRLEAVVVYLDADARRID